MTGEDLRRELCQHRESGRVQREANLSGEAFLLAENFTQRLEAGCDNRHL